jgi:hypothetical protein
MQIAAQQRLPLYVLIGSIISAVLLVAYVLQYGTGEGAVGEEFVNQELPPPNTFPYFLKPITWLMIAAFAGWFSLLELAKGRIRRLDREQRYTFGLILFIFAAVAFYEILYNFMYWGAILARQAVNPDSITNGFPSQLYQVNIVFATKVYVTVFVCALYALAVLRQSNKD